MLFHSNNNISLIRLVETCFFSFLTNHTKLQSLTYILLLLKVTYMIIYICSKHDTTVKNCINDTAAFSCDINHVLYHNSLCVLRQKLIIIFSIISCMNLSLSILFKNQNQPLKIDPDLIPDLSSSSKFSGSKT